MPRASPFQPEYLDSDACAQGFRWLCYGFVLVILSLHFINCDILPDFIGWGLMAVGFSRIAPSHPTARVLAWVSTVMIFVSLASLLTLSLGQIVMTTWFIASSLVELWVTWSMCGIVADIARMVGDMELKEKAEFRRKLYGIGVLLMAAAAVATPLQFLFGIPGLLIVLVSLVLIIMLLVQAKRVCDNYIIPHWADETLTQFKPISSPESGKSEPPGR